jgi:anti-sigma factor RsiW
MRCADARRRLGARLDRRLGPADLAALDAHLAACAACRGELARWDAAAATLRAAGPTPIPVGLAERACRAALAAGRAPSLSASFVRAARPALVAGVAAAAALWLGFLAAGAPAPPRAPDLAADPMELAMQLWNVEAIDGE